MSEEYTKIRKRIRLKKGFYIHFGIYIIVNIFLFLINHITDPLPDGYPWFLFPLVSWGTAVAIHALSVFGFSSVGLFGDAWESKQIDAELKKRGLGIEEKRLPRANEIDMDQHLELKEIEKKTNYDEQDLV